MTSGTSPSKFGTNPLFIGCLLALASFLIYARTTAPTVLPGDAGEFQFAAWGFWLAHPTGYPLYLLLGGLTEHLLPFGDPAYRLNLLSAFFSALAVGVTFGVLYQITRSKGAAAIAALGFAVTPLVWSQAIHAEVYALQTLLVALLCLFAVLWRNHPRPRYAAAFALTLGLALAHHRTTILLLLPLAVLLVSPLMQVDRGQLVRRGILYAILAALPLLLYLYIPLRAPATPYALLALDPAPPIVIFENSPQGWLQVILGTGFAGELSINASTWDSLKNLPGLLASQWNYLGALLGLLGWAALLRQQKYTYAAFSIVGVGVYTLFAGIYHIGDIFDYYAGALFFFSIAVAAGIAFLLGWLETRPRFNNRVAAALVLAAVFILVPLFNFAANFAAADESGAIAARTQWDQIMSAALPANAILLSDNRDEMTPFYYKQLVEGKQPGWNAIFPKIAPGTEFENVVALVNRVAPSGRPIYAIKSLPALALFHNVTSQPGGLWQIDPAPLPAPEISSGAVLGSSLGVTGYSVLSGEPRAGQPLTLGVTYRVLAAMGRDYKFSVQLLDSAGNKVAQGNDHVPGAPDYPPTRWQPNDAPRDLVQLDLPPDLAPGTYHLTLSAYDPDNGADLGDPQTIGSIVVH